MSDILSDKESAIITYGALLARGGSASRDELEPVIEWAIEARLDAAALAMAIAGDIVVKATKKGIQYRKSTPDERAAIQETARKLGD